MIRLNGNSAAGKVYRESVPDCATDEPLADASQIPSVPTEGGGIKTFQTPLPFALLGMLEKLRNSLKHTELSVLSKSEEVLVLFS